MILSCKMMSTEEYISSIMNKSYPELMKERDKLINRMRLYEKRDIAGEVFGEALEIPHPEDYYVRDFYNLAELCRLMHNKYYDEYVSGGRTLKQDADEKQGSKAGL